MTENIKAKEFFKWTLALLICWIIFIVSYLGYLYFFKDVRIEFTSKIQENYAEFLVKEHDNFLDSIIEFEAITSKIDKVYSEEEIEIIEKLLLEQNSILKRLQQYPPDATNEDYFGIYQDSLKIISFYIQGEIMKTEYIYNYKEEYLPDEELSGEIIRVETYTIGHQLCNIMANMLLNDYKYINEVRGTNFESKFNIIPVEEAFKDKITEEQDNTIRNNLENASKVTDLLETNQNETETKLLDEIPIIDKTEKQE